MKMFVLTDPPNILKWWL